MRVLMGARLKAVLESRAADGFVGRICVLSFRTHQDRMEMALEDLRAAAAELLG